MTATYTFDVFSTLDGYGSYDSSGDWGGYWGKQGPEFLDRRLALYGEEQRMVLGANTFRQFVEMLGPSTEESELSDPVNTRMRNMPTTVVSTTLEGPLDWPDATLVSGDAVDVVARLKEESEVPLRSHGSLSMNRALMAAGLVDRVQVTLFPVITGQTGDGPDLPGCGRLRPRADREPDARRPHPGAHLPAHPAIELVRAWLATNKSKSQRGVKGGYTFARDPSEVTVLEVVELLDGPLGASAESIFADAAAAARAVLQNATIADVVESENRAAGAQMYYI